MNQADKISGLILAAGKGTRMHSNLPKVLQKILGQPMLRYVYDAVDQVCGEKVWTVVGHGINELEKAFPARIQKNILQAEQLGTGHALQVAWENKGLHATPYLLVVNGDTPLLPAEKLQDFFQQCVAREYDIAFMSLTLQDPRGFGRVVRKNNQVCAVIEAKDYDESVHGPCTGEINAGIYCLRMGKVSDILKLLKNNNKNNEFYITDLIGLGVANSLKVGAIDYGNCPELLGVNDPYELVCSEEIIRASLVEKTAKDGVIIRFPQAVRLGPDVMVEKGVSLTGPLEISGNSIIRSGAVIDSHCVIVDSIIDSEAHILSFSHLEGSFVGQKASVGPYARLRPGAELGKHVKVGNFVEIKKSILHDGAKASHLSYIGDAQVGEGANIGAGTITCNYDGKNKYITEIGAEAFIGSNTSLVAPVTVGPGATIGAGSVITKNVPAEYLGVTRAKQVVVEYPRKK